MKEKPMHLFCMLPEDVIVFWKILTRLLNHQSVLFMIYRDIAIVHPVFATHSAAMFQGFLRFVGNV